jgi:hypothetical protein
VQDVLCAATEHRCTECGKTFKLEH